MTDSIRGWSATGRMAVSTEIDAAVERIWSQCIRSTVGHKRGTDEIRAELLAAEARGAAVRPADWSPIPEDTAAYDRGHADGVAVGRVLNQPAPDFDPIGGPIVPGDFPAHLAALERELATLRSRVALMDETKESLALREGIP
jgi:hypothetical protein